MTLKEGKIILIELQMVFSKMLTAPNSIKKFIKKNKTSIKKSKNKSS